MAAEGHDAVRRIERVDHEDLVVDDGASDREHLIVRGHRALAEAYAVHILDVYDHYRFRAVEAELSAEKKNPAEPEPRPIPDSTASSTRRMPDNKRHRIGSRDT